MRGIQVLSQAIQAPVKMKNHGGSTGIEACCGQKEPKEDRQGVNSMSKVERTIAARWVASLRGRISGLTWVVSYTSVSSGGSRMMLDDSPGS